MITLEKVTKKFPKQIDTAIKTVSLKIPDHDFAVLLGPSGSGKSTILHLLAGLTKPTSGKIHINNKIISQLTDQEASLLRNQTIGFIFQEFHLIPHLTVRQNIELPSQISHSKTSQTHIDSLIKEVGLTNKQHDLPSALSGGQKQRVAIARALVNNPSIILADEPTGNLDQATAKTIIQLLKSLHEKHRSTLIIATHDEEIAKIAKHKIFIRDGQITKD
ncbi:peptide ABC transporter ATP-binding protein [Candidatus Peregrinibacteria bacterium HGW-Peregrinibacteria-1]|jgi:putative ABC transport system ATP-binding protein|nr:MAG: peptide ABC transporter ATP-binding protein [Candidatus Peregrinibacteria bacterium HGW-Peregrinibacteria-1]